MQFRLAKRRAPWSSTSLLMKTDTSWEMCLSLRMIMVSLTRLWQSTEKMQDKRMELVNCNSRKRLTKWLVKLDKCTFLTVLISKLSNTRVSSRVLFREPKISILCTPHQELVEPHWLLEVRASESSHTPMRWEARLTEQELLLDQLHLQSSLVAHWAPASPSSRDSESCMARIRRFTHSDQAMQTTLATDSESHKNCDLVQICEFVHLFHLCRWKLL